MNILHRWAQALQGRFRRSLPPAAVFEQVYEKGLWGGQGAEATGFYSGTGSRDAKIVTPYVTAVSEFLSSFASKPNVVDLGCGDFHVGSQLRPLCDRYIACDVVQRMIDSHKQQFAHLNVDFRCMDITAEALPPGQVLFIRQVLQHLSNQQIAGFVNNLRRSECQYLVLMEHVPHEKGFVPNRDKQTGAAIRLEQKSGVVLTAPPFNLQVLEARSICKAEEFGGLVETWVYKLRA